jgi:phosphate-selective porin OprO/OprP
MRRFLVVLLLLSGAGTALAQVVDPRNVVIRNIHIVAPEAEDVTVNLLIRDNKLEIVSKDKITTPAGFVALDAEGGYVVGTLRLKESPSFIILDGDPREDFDVLLDTEEHAVFAVHAGKETPRLAGLHAPTHGHSDQLRQPR